MATKQFVGDGQGVGGREGDGRVLEEDGAELDRCDVDGPAEAGTSKRGDVRRDSP